MALSVKDIIKFECSGLYNSADLDSYIEIATQLTSSSFFGVNYNYAIALRACHNYALTNGSFASGVGGAVRSIKEGDLSISYGQIAGLVGGGDLQLTSYGIRLKGLIDSGPGAISVTGSNIIEELDN